LGAPQPTAPAVPKRQLSVNELSVASANLAQAELRAAVLLEPLMPISKLESQLEAAPASRLPSALKKRTACWPDPGVGTVPLLGEASKLPEGLLCLKMMRIARGPVATTVGAVEVAVELEDEAAFSAAVWRRHPEVVVATAIADKITYKLFKNEDAPAFRPPMLRPPEG
jgi:hypothetical protein